MRISQVFITAQAKSLLADSKLADQANKEVLSSISSMITNGLTEFHINNSMKNCNGVVPIKDKFYQTMENEYQWYREYPLVCFSGKKGGPIDVYKEFSNASDEFRAGLEFETGNISSAHRSLNKLLLGIRNDDIDLAFLVLPVACLGYYLTDRIATYEELEPYFELASKYPFIVYGFDAEQYGLSVPLIKKGRDGMSKKSKRLWRER